MWAKPCVDYLGTFDVARPRPYGLQGSSLPMKKTQAMLGTLFTICALATTNGAPPPTIMDQLIGSWTLTGTIAGKQTTHDVTVEWVLKHGYVRIHEVSREKEASGVPVYEAFVFISRDASGAECSCLWLDSTGTTGFSADAVGHAKLEKNAIPFLFKDASGNVTFENTFSYDAKSDSWAWMMNNVDRGRIIPFGRVKLVRKL